MKLKNLKDIESFFVTEFIPKKVPQSSHQEVSNFEGKTNKKRCSGVLIDINDLKQEAIKWIRKFQKDKEKVIFENQLFNENNLCEKYFKEGRMFEDKINDWKKFFNITEEDLK